MDMCHDWKALAKEQESFVLSFWKELHAHPELSGEEKWTSGRIAQELTSLGVPFTVIENYSLVAVLDTQKPGKRLALRADIDALPVQEETGLPFASAIPGKMHACGHDTHTAILMGVIRMLLQVRDSLTGKIYFCFQLGEEKGIGAKAIVSYLKEQGGVDQVFGLHISSQLPTGSILLPLGALCAGISGWTVTVNGKGGHGSKPHEAVDPIKPACEILLRYASIPVNRVALDQPLVVSPCTIHAGSANNIIPDTATITGTIRYFSLETREQAKSHMEQIAQDVARSYGASARLDMPKVNLPVVNHKESALVAHRVIESIQGLTLVESAPQMGSDNFGDFVASFPGFYCFLGAQNPEKFEPVPHHNPKFQVDEDALPLGCAFLGACVEAFLK